MFVVECPTLDRQVMITILRVEAVVNHEFGIDVRYECGCGATAVWRSGAKAPREELIDHQPPGVASVVSAPNVREADGCRSRGRSRGSRAPARFP